MSNDLDTTLRPSPKGNTKSNAEKGYTPDHYLIKQQIEARRKSVELVRRDIANSANTLSDTVSGDIKPPHNMQKINEPWCDPLPLDSRSFQADYPVDSLPPLVRDVITEVRAATQAPTPMVANAALCALATASQGLIDIRRDQHLTGPASLFFLTLGDSGERKSTVDSLFARPLRDFHRESMDAGAEELMQFRSQSDVWKAKCDGITALIRASHKGNKSPDKPNTDDLERQLAELHKNEPQRPPIPNILVLDITTEKLAQQLAKEWPSCVLTSAEGGLVFGGRSFSKENQLATLAAFNALWSDEPLRVSRKTSESFEVHGARLSLSLFVQPGVFGSFLESNDIARSIGFLARCLFSFPDSTQGTRLYRDSTNEFSRLDAFNVHVGQLLRITPKIEKGRLIPAIVDLSPEAKTAWIEFYDEIEAQLGKGQELEFLRDFGSKAAEQAVRVAAAFQISTGFPFLRIEKENMIPACDIVRWHLGEVKRYFGIQSPGTRLQMQNAEKLQKWLVDWCRRNPGQNPVRSLILQSGPVKLRRKNELKPVLRLLEGRRRVRLMDEGKTIAVNPILWRAAHESN